MITIKETKDILLVHKLHPYKVNVGHQYLLIENDDIVVGAYEIQPMSSIFANIHIFIKQEHRKKGYGIQSYKSFIIYMTEKTEYKKLMCTIPANNFTMLNGLQKTMWKACGNIHNSIIWFGELTDLIIFEHSLR